MQNKSNLHVLPDAEQVRLEWERLNKKARSKKQNIMPSPEQIAAERSRLKKRNDQEEKVARLKQTPVKQPKPKKHKNGVRLPTQENVLAERSRLRYCARFRKAFSSTVYALIIVAAVAVLISSLFLPVLQISGDSMEPTLQNGEIIVVVKTNRFETGDLCCFSWNNRVLIKRIIAGPGDWVDIQEDGTVLVNYRELEEPYVTGKSLGETDLTYPYQIPEKSYFVLGDKRETSIDSRSSVIGCVYVDQIIGKVQFRIWPLDGIGFVNK